MVIWKDGSIGILIERFDLYTRGKIASRNYTPCWCWRIEFPNSPPYNYNIQYGESEINLMNRNKIKKIISC